MQKRTVRGVLVDHCAPCNGIWLDGGELDALETGRRRPPEALSADERLETLEERSRDVAVFGLCPRCQRQLVATALRGVEVDQCSACGGIYFDQGELPAVLRSRTGPIARLLSRVLRR